MLRVKKLVGIVVVLLLAVAAGSGAYYYLNSKNPLPKSSTPPVLELTKNGGARFQGVVDKGGALAVNTAKLLPAGTKVNSPAEYAISADVVAASFAKANTKNLGDFYRKNKFMKGSAYYYATAPITPAQIWTAIYQSAVAQDPAMSGTNEFVISYYNLDDNKFMVFPPTTESATMENWAADKAIPAYHPFVVYAKSPSPLPSNFKDWTDTLTPDGTVTAANLIGATNGWHIIPANTTDLKAFLAPVKAQGKLTSYYAQTNSSNPTDFVECTATAGANLCAHPVGHFVWVSIGPVSDGPPCDSATGVCTIECIACGLTAGDDVSTPETITININDIAAIGCAQNPALCAKFDYQSGNAGNFSIDQLFDKDIKNDFTGGFIDPPMFEERFTDFSKEYLNNQLGTLGGELDSSTKDSIASGIATDVTKSEFEAGLFKNEFSSTAASNFATAITQIIGDSSMDKNSALDALGNALQKSITDAGTSLTNKLSATNSKAFNDALSATLKNDTALNTAFKSTFSSTVSKFSSKFQSAGVQFDSTAGGFKSFKATGATTLNGATNLNGSTNLQTTGQATR